MDMTRTTSDTSAANMNFQIGALDPGEPGTATNGTASVSLVRDDSVDAGMPWKRGFFTLPDGADALKLGFAAGQTVTFSFPGGTDLGAFSGSMGIPADLSVTSPNLAAAGTTLNLSGALNLAWQAGNPTDIVEVTIIGSTSGIQDNGDGTQTTTMHTVMIQCELPDTGSGSISRDLMARIPPDSSSTTLSLKRTRSVEASVPLMRVSGNGVVKLVGQTGVSRTWISEMP
jgi:hypothetical protein